MKQFLNTAFAAFVLFLDVPQLPAADGAGLAVEVNRRSGGKATMVTRTREELKKAPLMSLARNRSRSNRRLLESTSSWQVSVRPTQLTVNAKNSTLRAMPEGQVEWTVLVERVYGGVERYSGVETLPPLRSLQAVEVLLGSPIPVGETRTPTGPERDNVEYEIVISHNDEETFRTASCANFTRLNSVAKQHLGGGAGGTAPKAEGQPAIDAGGKREDIAKIHQPTQPLPGAGEKMSPALPAPVETAKPSVEPPPVPPQPFDFFNLGGQKSAAKN